jgi:hypothetical protein
MEPRKFEGYTIRYTLPRSQIMNFVGELHAMQHDMIEAVVAQKEKQGFPEARELLDYIMSK